MGEEAYQFLFSIPAKGALNMGSEGGGVLKVEFSQESSDAIVALIQRAIARGGCVFAAAVVEVEETNDAKEENKHGLAKWHKS